MTFDSRAAMIYPQVTLKREGDRILVILPAPTTKEDDWLLVCQGLKFCLYHQERHWSERTPTILAVGDRLLDNRQLPALVQILQEHDLKISIVRTSRRQTAVTAATAGYSVEQGSLVPPPLLQAELPLPDLLADPLYLKTTVRSGVEIRHPGSVILVGDVNPGGEIIADGDILIWGSLRGVAHAGASGNREACIMALRMEPTQLRIVDLVARVPPAEKGELLPEIAYITPEGIHLKQSLNFMKPDFLKKMRSQS